MDKTYFQHLDFYDVEATALPEFQENDVLDKITWWIDVLNPLRHALGFPITITDGYRIGLGTSQHHFAGKGAVDLRPANKQDHQQFVRLAYGLLMHKDIGRVCYYPQGDLFPWGGFHIDCKVQDKVLYVSAPNHVDWQVVGANKFIHSVRQDRYEQEHTKG